MRVVYVLSTGSEHEDTSPTYWRDFQECDFLAV